MSTIKTTLNEYKVISQLAKQHQVATGETIKVIPEFKRGAVMVTAPKGFLLLLGF